MPNLKIPTPLRPYANNQSTLALSGEIVSEVLEAAVEQYPELKNHLFSEERQLRPYVNLFLGEENINQMQGLETRLKKDDTLLIIPSIAGGLDYTNKENTCFRNYRMMKFTVIPGTY